MLEMATDSGKKPLSEVKMAGQQHGQYCDLPRKAICESLKSKVPSHEQQEGQKGALVWALFCGSLCLAKQSLTACIGSNRTWQCLAHWKDFIHDHLDARNHCSQQPFHDDEWHPGLLPLISQVQEPFLMTSFPQSSPEISKLNALYFLHGNALL